jgi:hypothetical protein
MRSSQAVGREFPDRFGGLAFICCYVPANTQNCKGIYDPRRVEKCISGISMLNRNRFDRELILIEKLELE